jgi:hypothetical protein
VVKAEKRVNHSQKNYTFVGDLEFPGETTKKLPGGG